MTLRTRKKNKPVDSLYWYVALPYANSKEEGPLAEKRIGQLSVPVEYSISPSGCICYRILRSDVREDVGLRKAKINEWNNIPYALPGGQTYVEEDKAVWGFHSMNALLFLFKEWKLIPRAKLRSRRAVTPEKSIRLRKRRI